MAQTTVIRITHDKDVASIGTVNRIAGMDSARAREVCLALAGWLERIASGLDPATVEISAGGTAGVHATGTLTLSSASGAVGGTIGGTAKTVTASGGDAATAAALAAAIQADATITKLVYATASGSVVTINAHAIGTVGNKITLVASGTGVTASGATLTTGAGDDTDPVSYTRS